MKGKTNGWKRVWESVCVDDLLETSFTEYAATASLISKWLWRLHRWNISQVQFNFFNQIFRPGASIFLTEIKWIFRQWWHIVVACFFFFFFRMRKCQKFEWCKFRNHANQAERQNTMWHEMGFHFPLRADPGMAQTSNFHGDLLNLNLSLSVNSPNLWKDLRVSFDYFFCSDFQCFSLFFNF